MKKAADPWLMLVASLSGRSPTPRMRLWRALKAAGAVALRDGVYVLPAGARADGLFRRCAADVLQAGGDAHVVSFAPTDAAQETTLRGAFDRTPAYAEQLQRLAALRTELARLDEADARRRLAVLQREFAAIAAIDFFPAAAREQLKTALQDAEHALEGQFSPDEPHAIRAHIPRRERAQYSGRVWATRRHLWVDRVACAWLIRRFIDPKARFLWLAHPADCPPDALGFDFDGAAFTHVGARVSFEVLVAAFTLERDPALARLGQLVRYLDVGGVPVPDAAGFASVMGGARARHGQDDDALLRDLSTVLDCLYAAYLSAPGEPS